MDNRTTYMTSLSVEVKHHISINEMQYRDK